MGIEKIKPEKILLNKKQLELRNKVQNQKQIMVDGETSLSDIAKALADTKKPMNFTIIRDNKEFELKPIY